MELRFCSKITQNQFGSIESNLWHIWLAGQIHKAMWNLLEQAMDVSDL